MISLDSTKTLDIDGTGTAGMLRYMVSGVDISPTADVPFSYTGAIGTGLTTIVPAPASGNQRVVKSFVIRLDPAATATTRFSVCLTDGGTTRYLTTAALRIKETFAYESGTGFNRYGTDGGLLVEAAASQPVPLTKLRVPYNKVSLSTMVAGSEGSTWRATLYPLQGAVPAAAAVCTNTSTGAFPLAVRSGAEKRRLLELALLSNTAGQTFFVEDRLGHMGGLNGTLTTAQTVSLNLASLGNNVSARIGASDYSEVTWYLEWYTATGSTVTTPTVAVTYADDSTGNCNVWVTGATALPASVAASRRYQIVSATGKGIKAVNTVTLSASTATAGNFGVTATRRLATLVTHIANKSEILKYDSGKGPVIEDEACLTLAFASSTTSSGIAVGTLTQEVS